MNNDADAVQTAAALASNRGHDQPASRPGDLNAGYRAAVATGAPDVEGTIVMNEETPLLSRTDTSSSIPRKPIFQTSSSTEASDRQHSPPRWQGELDFQGLPWYRKPSVLWLLFPYLMYAATFGGTIVPGIEVITDMLCRERLVEMSSVAGASSDPLAGSHSTDPDPIFCGKDPKVQASVTIFVLCYQVIGGVLAAFTSPKIGSLSDRYGRNRFIAFTSMGALAKDAMYILIFTSAQPVNVRWLLLAYALDGLCGSFTAGMAIIHAYASDCTPPDKRAMRFGWFHGCLFSGIAFGPIVSGYLIKLTGKTVSAFFAASIVHVLFICFVLFVVPESLTHARQMEARKKKAIDDENYLATVMTDLTLTQKVLAWNRRQNILAPLRILFPTGPGTSSALRRNMGVLATIDTIVFGVAMGSMTVTILYTKQAFGWGTFENSAFMSAVSIARVTVLMLILPITIRLLRGKPVSGLSSLREDGCDRVDILLIAVPILFDMLGYLGYALAPTGGLMVLSGVIGSIGSIASPTLQSSLTKHVPPEQVGQILGAVGLLHALARVVSPIAAGAIYAKTILIGMPQTVFWVLSACFGFAFLISLFIRKGVFVDAKAIDEERERLLREESILTQERGEEEQIL